MWNLVQVVLGIGLILFLASRVLGGGGRRGGRVRFRVRYGPSIPARIGMVLLKTPVWAVNYWYVSVPIVATGVISYLVYAIAS